MMPQRLVGCFLFLLFWANAPAIEVLETIEDLKGKEFGNEYPLHGLMLLHWLADQVNIDPLDSIQLLFDPLRQDYGSHFCNNTSSFLSLNESLDILYYSLGSLSSETFRTKLPPYVTQDFYNAPESSNRDIDRIIIGVQRDSPRKAEKVYITQALNDEQTWNYEHNQTFEITSKLLRQIQVLEKPLDLIQTLESHASNSSMDQSDPRLVLPKDQLLFHLKYTEKGLQSIFEQQALRWLLILAGYDIKGRFEVHRKTLSCSAEQDQSTQSSGDQCDGPIKIEVKSTQKGYARITWRDIPKNIIDIKPALVIFKSDSTNELETFIYLEGKTMGSADTYLQLNHGLHPRLVNYNFANKYGFLGLRYSFIWRGPQFDEANRVIPTDIAGYNASLQLFTKNGYACARLLIKESFVDWKEEFSNSWVGFYASDQSLNHQHTHYQWISKFEKVDHKESTNVYFIFEYESSVNIGPGVQARFLFSSKPVYTRYLSSWSSVIVKARTVPWENMYN